MKTDQRGYHRREDHKHYKMYYYPITDVQPYDILLTSSKSMIGLAVRLFSQIDGRRAFVSHVGQILGDGVTVSEANYPRHEYTALDHYLESQERDECRLTIVRIKDVVWGGDMDLKAKAQRYCEEYHRIDCFGDAYEELGLFPMALFSIFRNILPVKGRFLHIPKKKQEKLHICSVVVDEGWAYGQQYTCTDFFPSSLSLHYPSPQDIYDSPHTEFVSGWTQEVV